MAYWQPLLCQLLAVAGFAAAQFQSIAEVISKLEGGALPANPTLFNGNPGVLGAPLADSYALFTPRSYRHRAWINSGKFQGDIDGVNPALFMNDAVFGLQYNAIKNKQMVWPKGVVPYAIAPQFTSWEQSLIKKAIETYHKKTCVQFVPRTWQRDYLNIVKSYGCYSQVGKTGGRQEMSLGRGCLYHEIIVHELMHTLGFWHEHSRADRDHFIRIVWDNISPGMRGQFDKISAAYQDLLGESYDYLSVMHYDSTAFSKNGRNTIEAVDSRYTKLLGTATDLSVVDLRKVNKLYNCQARPRTPPPTTLRPTTRRITPNPIIVTSTHRPIVTTRPKPPPLPPPVSKVCYDKFLDCPFFSAYCHRSNSFMVMKSYCPFTCGHCVKGTNQVKPENQFARNPIAGRLFNG